MIYAEILAGGKGTRMGNTDMPKQFLMLGTKPIIIHTIEQFLISSKFSKIIVCCPKDWITYMNDLLEKYLPNHDIDVVVGGKTRNETIMNGCKFIEENYGLNDDDTPTDPAIFRMDWWAWMEDWSKDGVKIAESQEKGGTWCDWGSEIATAVKDAEVTYTFVRTGNDLCITTTLHSNTYDKTFPTMTQYLRGINRAKIGVALSSEFTVAQINGLWRMK